MRFAAVQLRPRASIYEGCQTRVMDTVHAEKLLTSIGVTRGPRALECGSSWVSCGMHTTCKASRPQSKGSHHGYFRIWPVKVASGLISTDSRFQTIGSRFAPRFVACLALSEASSQKGYQAWICYHLSATRSNSFMSACPISNLTFHYLISAFPRTIIDKRKFHETESC